ncbi:hypothetical protein V5799_007972 [Amblyomma americanum]|uniref:Serpin domain-containing protein n=1 Tax=Amblyomma americanum TaxID=6943 RepID=A0AAQ4FEL8_AMBAM
MNRPGAIKAGPRPGDLEGLAECVQSLRLCDAVRMGNLLHANTALAEDYLTVFEGSLGGKGSCLVNVVYLHSRWEEAFRRAGEQPFYAEPDRGLLVPMMTQTSNELPYLREPRFACVRLPYDCPASQMALFLPALREGGLEKDVLPALARWADVRAVLDRLAWTTDVTVTLPKHATAKQRLSTQVMLESPTIDVRKSLKSVNRKRPPAPNEASPGSESKPLGANNQATNKGADKPNQTASTETRATPSTTTVGSNDVSKAFSYADDLWVDGLFHKATLDLTTRGGRSPPGFSTLLSLCSTIPANEPVRFTVDRPFMFVVLKEDLLLMVGLVRNVAPKAKDDDLKRYFL